MFVLTSMVRGRSQPAPMARVIPAGRLLRADGTTRTPVFVECLEEAVEKVIAVHRADWTDRGSGKSDPTLQDTTHSIV